MLTKQLEQFRKKRLSEIKDSNKQFNKLISELQVYNYKEKLLFKSCIDFKAFVSEITSNDINILKLFKKWVVTFKASSCSSQLDFTSLKAISAIFASNFKYQSDLRSDAQEDRVQLEAYQLAEKKMNDLMNKYRTDVSKHSEMFKSVLKVVELGLSCSRASVKRTLEASKTSLMGPLEQASKRAYLKKAYLCAEQGFALGYLSRYFGEIKCLMKSSVFQDYVEQIRVSIGEL